VVRDNETSHTAIHAVAFSEEYLNSIEPLPGLPVTSLRRAGDRISPGVGRTISRGGLPINAQLVGILKKAWKSTSEPLHDADVQKLGTTKELIDLLPG